MTLKISADLSLPLDFVTKTCAILAQRRKGKTYTASVLAEELIAAKAPFVVLDPTGAWWGLRASADGERPGLPVVILGGQHGDVPLERTGGKFVAELVVDEPGFYVIDFSLFESGAAEKQFATDFAQRLYRRKGQPNSDFALHLFIDEADRFIPQRIQDRREGDAAMLGAFEAIVRRGGLRGLGTTLISQRAAVVNKNVLEMIDILIALRTVGPNDRAAVDEYVKSNATAEQRSALMGSLSSLDIGEAWVWEPGGDPPLFERVRIRERHTFNSSATPKSGERRVEPRRLAEVDLEAIKEQMADTIERAKADDPKELRRRIAQLEKELAARPIETKVETVERVEVPVLEEALVIRLEQALEPIAAVLSEIQERLTWEVSQQGQSLQYARKLREPSGSAPANRPEPREPSRRHGETPPPRPVRTAPARTESREGDVKLGKAERAVLAILAQSPQGRDHKALSILTGYSAKASTIGVALSVLRRAGLVEPSGVPTITPDGLAVAADVEPLPSGQALIDYWRAHQAMGKAERLVFDELVSAYPEELTHADLCELTGYSSTASTIGVALSKLRRLGIVDGWRASDDLFGGER